MPNGNHFEIDNRVQKLEITSERHTLQIERLVSDAESEKRTRSEMNRELFKKLDKWDERFRSIERKVWIAVGAVGALEIVLRIFGK
ncbi:hypothetical protein KGQ31_03640 [Patescibacteria group bacterium]|nr:hypothetical protein [Patescibacteria group bacterium]